MHEILMHRIRNYRIQRQRIKLHRIQMLRIQMHQIQMLRIQMHQIQIYIKWIEYRSMEYKCIECIEFNNEIHII